ncbi:hypothetical protein NDU88_008119 [Pleurodeles waltl]|uniref:Uncharacterized protein n=1 Tax=Pleurodeles waltl TaxID=8319 RepID=A0AAV7NC62_PLEWA|nr:hypothetical protein NDU88_008119 [Pleurodeles waltl]
MGTAGHGDPLHPGPANFDWIYADWISCSDWPESLGLLEVLVVSCIVAGPNPLGDKMPLHMRPGTRVQMNRFMKAVKCI